MMVSALNKSGTRKIEQANIAILPCVETGSLYNLTGNSLTMKVAVSVSRHTLQQARS